MTVRLFELFFCESVESFDLRNTVFPVTGCKASNKDSPLVSVTPHVMLIRKFDN